MKRPSIGWLSKGFSFAALLAIASCSNDPEASSSTTGGGGCVAPAQQCTGGCANLSSDPTNCGTCGNACTFGQSCQAGACAQSCTAPAIDCGGLCANPASNALHCGGCNQACGEGQLCQNSTCVAGTCPSGQALCNGECVDTLGDPANCGACGSACLVGQSCAGGSCGATTCASGQTLCNGGCTDITSVENCGGCGVTCAAGESCVAGSCSSDGGLGGGTSSTTSTTTSTGGQSTTSDGNSTDGASTTTGGIVGPGVEESDGCPDITWPTGSGSTNLGSGITVGAGETYDGQMQVHEGSLENCSTGDQDSVDPLIDVQDGGTVKNVIMGTNVGDGIHCQGSCTIDNVWFPYVCDDAISALGGGVVNISNSGFKNARDKTIQHNGTGTVNIDNVYVETAGKLYRSCGEGCSGSSRRASLSNIVAIGVDQVAGVSENDTVTLENICVHRSFSICTIYEPGSSDESTQGANGSAEGPNANCQFTGDDTHALLSRVSGIAFSTESVCGGPNAYKSGSTATACVEGFDSCLKACMPGGYGFKQIDCQDNGRYDEGDGVICALPSDPTAAEMLAPSRVMGATNMVSKNTNCSNEWDIGIDSSNNAKYCVCVEKPGYYDFDNWLSWDCQDRWW